VGQVKLGYYFPKKEHGHQASSSVAMFAETKRHLASGGLDLEGDFDLDLGGDDEEAWFSCFFAPFRGVFLTKTLSTKWWDLSSLKLT